MVAPLRTTAGRASPGELIPLPARRYVLRVQVDGAEYVYDGTAKLASAQAAVLAALRGYNAPAASGAAVLALEGTLRTAARLMMPMLARLVANLRRVPAAALLLPELARLPKHTDPLEHLACWLVEAVFTALGTGSYVLEADDDRAYLDRARDLVVEPVRALRWQAPGMVDGIAPTTRQDDRDAASGEHAGA